MSEAYAEDKGVDMDGNEEQVYPSKASVHLEGGKATKATKATRATGLVEHELQRDLERKRATLRA